MRALVPAPRDLPVELFVASTSLRAKTSRERQDALKVLDVRALGLATSVIRDAVASGDLRLPSSLRPEELLEQLSGSTLALTGLVSSPEIVLQLLHQLQRVRVLKQSGKVRTSGVARKGGPYPQATVVGETRNLVERERKPCPKGPR